ncbi:MAG: DUF4298 domain-containing protein [Oscillospiraceae bacterium]|nr:DUF4298 domain-containing protein [Oscillospiraceae bacterium]
MTQLERIARMEALLRQSKEAVERFSTALEDYFDIQDAVRTLDAYYGSEDWRRDFADDEAGLLPKDLPRGVLSEDEIYDLLSDNRDARIRMLEILTQLEREG